MKSATIATKNTSIMAFANHFALDVIIAGAGQAGLGASYFLKKYNLRHIVFERGRIGETWRSQRWNSFRLNSINKFNLLPGMNINAADADKFPSHTEYSQSFEKYISDFELPVVEHAKIIEIEKQETLSVFKVTVLLNGSINYYYCRQVIIASGCQNEKKIPAFASNISSQIKQLHAGSYREADELPGGAVLVVGSAQSGCQITEDLLNAGRKVYFSTGRVGRVPRRYRGRDIFEWLFETGFFDLKTEDEKDPVELLMHPPQLSANDNGDAISLQSLAKKGAVIMGSMNDAEGDKTFFANNAYAHVQFADGFSEKVKKFIDGYITGNNIPAPAAEIDEADMPDVNGSCVTGITSLNLKEHNINSIIWATGFGGNFNYIRVPVFDEYGNPKHNNGITNVEGIYFLGLPWLRSRKSGTIHGIAEDAAFITNKVNEYALKRFPDAAKMHNTSMN